MVNRKSGGKGVCLEKETHIIVTTLALIVEGTDRTSAVARSPNLFPPLINKRWLETSNRR